LSLEKKMRFFPFEKKKKSLSVENHQIDHPGRRSV